jgi:hypothetical protein
MQAVLDACQAKLQAGHQQRSEGNPQWWRPQEAAMLGMGAVYDKLTETLQFKPSDPLRGGLDAVIGYVLQELLAKQGGGNSFLLGGWRGLLGSGSCMWAHDSEAGLCTPGGCPGAWQQCACMP